MEQQNMFTIAKYVCVRAEKQVSHTTRLNKQPKI
jgi:hypothetical protein